MRIAVVGAGPAGLGAAHHLGEDPRHAVTLFETRERFGGPVDHLFRLGVTLRHTAQVERLAVDDTGVDLWIHGLPERFELALVATSAAEAQALLARSGMTPHALESPLRRRVYFAGLAQLAADHPAVRGRTSAPTSPGIADTLRWLARRAGGRRAEYLDLSGCTWPLDAPAIYIANQRWLLDVVPRHLLVRSLRTPSAEMDATMAGELDAGRAVAFVVEGISRPRGRAADAPHGCGAALAALAVNAPIVPIAASVPAARRRRTRVHVVIGEPFYPETSAIDELMRDMCMVVRHLERLAERASVVTSRRSPAPTRARRSSLPRGA
jgi:hypothetical protein